MIKIEKKFPDAETVVIRAAGRLDRRTLPSLEEEFNRSRESGRRVVIELDDLTHIGAEGRAFLKAIRGSARLTGVRKSLKLEFEDSGTGQP